MASRRDAKAARSPSGADADNGRAVASTRAGGKSGWAVVLTLSSRTFSPCERAASRSAGAAGLRLAFHSGESTRYTNLAPSTFASRACADSEGGRWGRRVRSSASSHMARWTGERPETSAASASKTARGPFGETELALPEDIQMTLHRTRQHSHDWLMHYVRRGGRRLAQAGGKQPMALLGATLVLGAAIGAAVQSGEVNALRAEIASQDAQLDDTRRAAQREVNALAARLGELQAQANRLNALGDRLTRVAQLGDGEFDFNSPVGVGGHGPVRDMPAGELREGIAGVDGEFGIAGDQLSVLEMLLFNREIDRNSVPSRSPVAASYITSGFGRRADPFGGGSAYHKGIDFDARTGDTVMAVADGVVSYSGVRSGYGKVVEIDHGNGYVTRYAHNSANVVQVGDLVRVGQQIARAGSTGRSTGAHV